MFLLQDNAGSLTQSVRLSTHQNRRQEVFTSGALRLCGGALCLCRGLDIENLIKSPLVYCVSNFDLGSLVLCLEGLRSPKPPHGDRAGAQSSYV